MMWFEQPSRWRAVREWFGRSFGEWLATRRRKRQNKIEQHARQKMIDSVSNAWRDK